MQADLAFLAFLFTSQGIVSAGLLSLGQPLLAAAALGTLLLLVSPVCASCLQGLLARD
ncbi:MAG: hypothetical protein ACOC48_00195 [Thiohalospira sp.]|uniref:hypothetical protein n=1 Tax=Thiohalospira sp. TaxID=3080549 RepID=UPI00397FD573